MLDQLKAYIQAQQGIVGIETSPSSVPSLLADLKSQLGERISFWSLGEGLQDLASKNLESGTQDVQGVLEYLEEELEDNPDLNKVYCFWNFQSFLQENKLVKSKILSLCFKLKETQQTLLFLEETFDLPDMSELMPILSYPLPHSIKIEEELSVILNQILRSNPMLALAVSERMVRACLGLTLAEINDIFRYSFFYLKENFSEDTLITEFTRAKTNKLKRLGVELCNPPDCPVGGLHQLKTWLKRRIIMFSNAMQELSSLPLPKGVAIIGVPGCGKSLVAKNIGNILGIPVMRLDMGAMYNSLVGSSERNLRQVLKTAEAIAPVVLFIDELEKAFASAGSSSSSDNGVSARLFGTFLTWMQDKTAPVFIVATANRVENLPPEFLRKGRFDEMFFVDLPTLEERLEILGFHLAKAGVKVSQVGQEWLASASESYTGSELAHLVTEAKIIALSENRKVERSDFETVLAEIQPQAETQYEQINLIRSWARMYARPAS